ncbi:sigma 54-interacting transcriptional regulator [Thiohalobacter thiocyanaticus]|uniref:Sigma-54-dependent Fis family transcriptional regulator n=1 Tax=Thiohalobacter thiocyanaticus TaxID=585455 RepID=A0A426QHR5_9GAMM|nr:sigma 54-interacting transcriptional regulator [Thiohalobacter thiocyanaticus]RRQ21299.1 sigma-54-dependent Fis family transcriptional regulator [Thiohalobacter thiocyanaticus]
MSGNSTKPLNPVSFLQAFITQSLKIGARGCTAPGNGMHHYIEQVGLAASHCLESGARTGLGYQGAIGPEQYADVIINIKNQIGGNFSRASSEPGMVRVVNTRCPFGESVRSAPELCRMTASVFGGIAARNFGYAKVELRKRIATNHDCCDVCVYIDPDVAENKPGEEYRCEGQTIVSCSESAQVRARIETRLREIWCPRSAASQDEQPRLPPSVVAESTAMRNALEAVEIVAPTCATVLVTGETGVGKEVIARAIHAMSPRSDRELLAVNCGAIPENLVESTLFGHEKGAFTDAYNVHQGYFERADGGTLFLDEIDCLPIPAQARLLRVLQDGRFERVGGRHTLHTDVRIIAASNQDLGRAVEQGGFRRDLYYRLNVVPIRLPPLRERIDDIPPLVHHFLARLAEKHAMPSKTLNDSAWARIIQYDWPGNLRELENALERAFLFSRGSVIERVEAAGTDSPSAARDSMDSLKKVRQRAVQQAESEFIVYALKRYNGNVTAVARAMDVTPRAVHMRLKELGISAAKFRVPD